LSYRTAINSGENFDEKVFYAKSIPAFAKRLTNMPQEKLRYPISLTSDHDPKWNFLFESVLAGARDK